MYTYSTGLMNNGWAFTGSLGYRWGNEGNIEGIKYNSFSYFLGAEKVFNERHSLSLATWGTPTERGQQMAATEEAYYLATVIIIIRTGDIRMEKNEMHVLYVSSNHRLLLHGISPLMIIRN